MLTLVSKSWTFSEDMAGDTEQMAFWPDAVVCTSFSELAFLLFVFFLFLYFEEYFLFFFAMIDYLNGQELLKSQNTVLKFYQITSEVWLKSWLGAENLEDPFISEKICYMIANLFRSWEKWSSFMCPASYKGKKIILINRLIQNLLSRRKFLKYRKTTKSPDSAS